MANGIDVSTKEILEKVNRRMEESSAALVPWFYENMPEYYFRTHTEEEQVSHLQAIVSGMIMEEKHTMALQSPCGTKITNITPGGDMAALAGVLTQYIDRDIQAARIYASRDNTLRLDTFVFGPQPACAVDADPYKNAMAMIREAKLLPTESEGDFEAFLRETSEDYVEKFEPDRALRHFRTCGCLEGKERVQVVLEKDVYEGFDRVSVAMANPPRKGLLLRVAKIFAREGVQVDRAYVDQFDRKGKDAVAIMSFYLNQAEIDLREGTEQWERLKRQIVHSKWFAFHALEAFADEEGWPIGQVMLIQAAAEFAHQFLISKDIHAYTSGRITHTLLRHRDVAGLLFAYFEARFDPDLEVGRHPAQQRAREAARAAIREVDDPIAREILTYIYRFFRFTLRTNYYLPERSGLSFRLDPIILAPVPRSERPFGIYCFHGPYSFAFHVRYRDTARGGVRIVRTRSQEQYELESNRLFDEVTKLARAQQFKNKDIPEGGSKAVILLGPEGEVDLALRSMVDSFLDLLTVPEDHDGPVHPRVVDYLGCEEIIYLGPDENITPRHVVWMVDRATMRGYRWPAAFMSSKPGAGIAHKQYGVTSEGVVVFLHELLHTLGIDPASERFTVKLTGGPAGDVASNVMKILIREYGENARIVAMSDGHGAAYDPDGLDHTELMRLVNDDLKAADFDRGKLTGDGAMVVSTDEPGGARVRNSLHNTARADVFIPAGGRPDTINMSNWKEYLDRDGEPTSRGIVEGANIFISADARAALERAGVLAVPGPSANKTGVICSSYEILAGLILSTDEFLAIKEPYVAQLLDILRARARSEARVLMREYKLAAGERTMTELSYEISRSINDLADLIVDVLDKEVGAVAEDPLLAEVLLSYCPPVLAETHRDRVLNDLPRVHQLALLASFVAAKMLYQEGLGWPERLVHIRDVREVVYKYLEQERVVAALAAFARQADGEQGELAARILEHTGRRYLTQLSLGL